MGKIKSWNEFITVVEAMRNYQIEYSKTKFPSTLKKVKTYEMMIDRCIEEYKARNAEKKQAALFPLRGHPATPRQ